MEEATRIRKLVEPLGTGLELVERASQGLFAHAVKNFNASLSWLGAPRAIVRKLVTIFLALLLLWFFFGTRPYAITIPAALVPVEQRHYAAPFEARLAEILVRQRVNPLPVVEDGKLVGIVSRADVIGMMARRLDEEEPARD